MGGLDDSYEFFGGGFDLDHLVAYETGDDMFDMSEGFVGRMQFLIGYNSVQLTPRPAPARWQPISRNRERRLQRIWLRQRLQSAAVHCAPITNFTMIGCGDVACVESGSG